MKTKNIHTFRESDIHTHDLLVIDLMGGNLERAGQKRDLSIRFANAVVKLGIKKILKNNTK